MRLPAADPGGLPSPGLGRRFASFVYEGVLLFGIVMAAGLVYALLTQQRHALAGKFGLQVLLFLVLGLYFTWFWTRAGQTLAMKTWHLRLVRRDGQPLGWTRATVRYLLSWLWFLPGLATLHATGLAGGWASFAVLSAGALTYGALALLHPDRQYWHDVACGTRIVLQQPTSKQGPP